MIRLPEKDDPDAARNEAELFREAVRGVKPLGVRSAPPPGPKTRPRARFTRADRMAVLRESLEAPAPDAEVGSGEELAFRRPEVRLAVMRRLRRGEYRVQREIDLHGLTVTAATQVLREFLAEALQHQVRCVRIIHGKGLGSVNKEPVLKQKVRNWLAQKDEVIAFCQARPADGGSGALVVLLQSSTPPNAG